MPTLELLEQTMRRVGAALPPEEFVAAVAETYRKVQAVSEATMDARFRRTRAYGDFQALLREAALPAGARVLALGCGPGRAGRSAAFAAAVTREIYPEVKIEQAAFTPCGGTAAPAGQYDLVVTHSFLHFLLDLAPLGAFLRGALDSGGRYVMANEPNARFWRNAECLSALDRVDADEARRNRLRRYTDPSRYAAKLLRSIRPARRPDPTAGVNGVLRQRFGLRGELTAPEIARICDPYVPHARPGHPTRGYDGLDWSELEAGPLAGLRVEAVRTSGYVMRDNPDPVPERWRALDGGLAARYPLDGCSFSALWRRA